MQPLLDQLHEIVPVTIGTTAASVLILSRGVWVCGFTLRETTGGASADVDLIAGAIGSSDILATVTLTAGQSCRDVLPGRGVYCNDGVSLLVNAGSVRGALWVAWQ